MENQKSSFMGAPHLFILGAGASRAALPHGDKFGRKLSLMSDFVETLRLEKTLKDWGIKYEGRNFETIYSEIHSEQKYQELCFILESAIHSYFQTMRLPDYPTIYDHLVLSLRGKDIIATFNWDPFLFQASQRNFKFTQDLPRMLFLHGNVAIGYCLKDKKYGPYRATCNECGENFKPSTLLYPVEQKDYSNDGFIKAEWEDMKKALSKAYILTIFGYNAPDSDVEAIELLKEGWGSPQKRNLEEVELIDIKNEDELHSKWQPFIHSHHYRICNSFYDSFITIHPRRSCEAMWDALMMCNPRPSNSLPVGLNFTGLHRWFEHLIQEEIAEKQN
ncbi:MAG: hypothetical protein AB1814_00665 [Thermodesulfobacteriota bacterium]